MQPRSPGDRSVTCYYGDVCAPATAGALGLAYQFTAPSGTVTTKSYDPTGDFTGSMVSFRSYSATTATAYLTTGQPYCTAAPGEYAQGVRCPATPPAATAPPANVTSTGYDPTGRVVKTVGPTGATTLSTYGPTGKQYCSVAPTASQGVTCPAFATLTAPAAGDDPYLGATIDLYNTLGELVTSASPLGAVTTTTFTTTGELATQVTATGTAVAPPVTTTDSYDADGKVTSTTTGDATTKTSYDPTGNAFCTATPNAVAKGSATYHCPAWLALLGHIELSAAERRILIAARSKQGDGVTPRGLRSILGPEANVSSLLSGLIAKGLLVRVGERGGTRYVLSDEVITRAGATGVEARTRKRQILLDEMRKSGKLSTAEAADLLSEDMATVRRLLNDLVSADLARARGNTRGRRYYPV